MARVLLIDDEQDHREFVAALLQRKGHAVTAEASGRFVIERIGKVDFAAAFNVVITDIVMPNIEGIEVIRALKTACPACKIIAISGGGRYNASVDYLQLARRFGVRATLTKPFSIADMCTAVDGVLQAA